MIIPEGRQYHWRSHISRKRMSAQVSQRQADYCIRPATIVVINASDGY